MQLRYSRNKLSISQQGLLLISIPLAAQLAFFLALALYHPSVAPWLAGGATLSVVTAILIALISRRLMIQPLRRLTRDAACLVNGEPLAAAQQRHDEIGRVRYLLQLAGRKLADSREALDNQTRILQSVLVSMGDAVIVASDDGEILLMNPAAHRLFGSEDVFLPEPAAGGAGAFAPETVAAIPKAVLTRVLAGEPVDEFDVLLPASKVRPAMWVTVTGRLLHDAQYKARGAVIVSRDVSERKSIEQAVRRARADLEIKVDERTRSLAAVNRELANRTEENEAFVHSVSHDLRSPLVNLLGFSKELAQICDEVRSLTRTCEISPDVKTRLDALLNVETPSALRFIQTAVARMAGIIDALLRLSRAGRVAYQSIEVDLAETVAHVITGLSRTINESAAQVSCGPLPVVIGDPTALEQVFANLIGNSLNYLDPRRLGEIEIGCLPVNDRSDNTESNDRATLFVKDNGLGIPKQSIHQVFRPFQRLHPGVASGEGIGLAMLKRIVQRHSGRVWFESTEGIGTTFFVELPLAASPVREPALSSPVSAAEL